METVTLVCGAEKLDSCIKKDEFRTFSQTVYKNKLKTH